MKTAQLSISELLYDVTLPVDYIWKFMSEFCEKFNDIDESTGIKENRIKFDCFETSACMWKMKIKIKKEDEKNFLEFFNKFCRGREIAFQNCI